MNTSRTRAWSRYTDTDNYKESRHKSTKTHTATKRGIVQVDSYKLAERAHTADTRTTTKNTDTRRHKDTYRHIQLQKEVSYK